MEDLFDARILVVDDQAANVSLLVESLEDSGYRRVDGCSDPRQALKIHLQHPYNLILLDWRMPEMDGEGFIRALRNAKPDEALPVLVLTAQTDTETRLTALGLGVRDFINKPFNLDEALMRIRNQLEVLQLYHLKQNQHQQLETLVAERTAALDRLTRYDPVTGLLNRQGFLSTADLPTFAADCPNGQFMLILLACHGHRGMDGLGGYQVGDAALSELTERLNQSLPTHRILSHWREGKFAILIPGHDWEGAQEHIENIMQTPVVVKGYSLQIKSTTGVALYPDHGTDIELLVNRANLATGMAFRDQHPVRLFDSQMDERAGKRRYLEHALGSALEKKQLHLCYQPKVDLATGQILGCEALMRWTLEGKLIPPVEFIPLAEHTGLIEPLTHWAVTEAIAACARWKAEFGRWIPIAVNLSTTTIRSHKQNATFAAEFNQRIQSALHKDQVPGNTIEFEVTESAVASVYAIDILNALSDLGMGLSIDDFGTGYSSLSQLRMLPVNTLKVDRSFVIDLESSADARAVAKTVVALGKELNMKVVAEGVETKLQAALLLGMGCAIGQGYLYSKPLQEHDWLNWVKQYSESPLSL